MIRSTAVTLAFVAFAPLAVALARQQRGPGPLPIVREPAPISLDAPLAREDDALPLGNGRVGAHVWGADNVIHIGVDRPDVWDERTPDALQRDDWKYATLRKLVGEGDERTLHERFEAPYAAVAYPSRLPLARIDLVFPEGNSSRRFRLDLERAEVTTGVIPSRVRVHVSAALGTVLVRVDNGAPELRLVPPAGLSALGYEVAEVRHEADLTWFVQQAALGLSYAVAVRESRDEKGVSYAIAVADSRENPEPLTLARQLTEFGAGYDYDRNIANPHVERWRLFWGGSKIKLLDERVQAQYDLAKYLYSAGTRPGQPPLAPQGLWTSTVGALPPSRGAYANDFATPMSYLAYTTAGLFDEGLALFDYLAALRPQAESFARSFYGVPGLLLPGRMTLGGQVASGSSAYGLSPTSTAWLAHGFYLHWSYTRDRGFLERKAYPWCAGVGEALSALLVATDEGLLRLPLSSSPETLDGSARAWLTPDSNYDQALLMSLFGDLEAMAAELGQQEESRKWAGVLAKLEPLASESEGGALTVARGVPYRASQARFSHAVAIHPLGLVSIDGSPEERKLVESTVRGIRATGTGAWRGSSFAWYACLCARAGLADDALDGLEKYLSFTGRSGLHVGGDASPSGLSDVTERAVALEGNFLAMQAVQEMLLQSWGGVVRVFPAVSARWVDVEFWDLRAEGGFRVWAKRRVGMTTAISVRATVGGRLRLRDPFGDREPTWNRPVTKVGANYEIDLKAGEQLDGEAGLVRKQ